MSRASDREQFKNDVYESFEDFDEDFDKDENIRCKTCGSTDVRWRQQGGKWVLFSMEPGKVHVCDTSDDFGVVK